MRPQPGARRNYSGGLEKIVQSIEDTVSYKGCVSMTQTLEAVIENETARLLEKPAVPLRDGQHVRLTVETEAAPPVIAV